MVARRGEVQRGFIAYLAEVVVDVARAVRHLRMPMDHAPQDRRLASVAATDGGVGHRLPPALAVPDADAEHAFLVQAQREPHAGGVGKRLDLAVQVAAVNKRAHVIERLVGQVAIAVFGADEDLERRPGLGLRRRVGPQMVGRPAQHVHHARRHEPGLRFLVPLRRQPVRRVRPIQHHELVKQPPGGGL